MAVDHLHGLDGISNAQIAEHLKLYEGYVKQVNALSAQLAELRGKGKASGTNPEFAELIRRLGFEYNGMILHARLQGDRAEEVRRGVLPEHRLSARRAPAPRGGRGPAGCRLTRPGILASMRILLLALVALGALRAPAGAAGGPPAPPRPPPPGPPPPPPPADPAPLPALPPQPRSP